MGTGGEGWRSDLDADLRGLERRIAVLREQLDGLPADGIRTRIQELAADLGHAEQVVATSIEPPATTRGAAAGASDRTPVVLLVDDDADVRQVLGLQLRMVGMDVLEAGDGEEALTAAIGDGPIDAVVCDVHLPGASGIDLISAIHALPGRTGLPIVLLTSDRSAETVADGLAAGAADYIRKPVVQRELEVRLRRVLAEAGSRQATAETMDELEALAETDELTGLPNRRALQGALADRLGRSSTALLLLDVDGFKQVNDTDGHLEGDRILRAVAQVLRRSKRDGDVVGRWGGDEFALITTDIDADGLLALAHRILHTVRDIRSTNGAQTVSIGGARDDGDATDTTDLVARADAALYRAKALGRNRFELSD